MESFSQLLSEFVNRIGVSDAELARRLGVSRQTVFRWRQGMTQRPRHREDVMSLAAKLRLDVAERDQLLLAAGFRPETAPPDAPPAAATAAQPGTDRAGADAAANDIRASESQAVPPLRRRLLRSRWLWIASVVLAVGLLGMVITGSWRSVISWVNSVNPQRATSEPRRSAAGETLILVSPFANYGGGQSGFNVAGRLQEALVDAFDGSGLEPVRVEVLPQTIVDETAARQTAARLDAELLIWGEYDSGRVVAHISAPEGDQPSAGQERRWSIETGEELSATINTDLPQDVQWMALYSLGRVHYMAGQGEQAAAVFQQALKVSPQDPSTRGAIYDYLGLIESQKASPDQDKVIAYYTEATELLPALASVLNNRGVAYVERSQEGDLTRAIDDFRQAIRLDPEFSAAHLNLAIVLLRENPDNVDEAIGLLVQAENLEPDSPGVQNALCWDLSLASRPDQALTHCDRAVQLDRTGYSNDSRGVALAMLGRYEEAVGEFHLFLDTLQKEDTSAYERYSASRLEWIASLEEGLDPFDAATRRALLQE